MVGQEMMIIIKLLFPLIIRNNGLNDALTMINDNTSSRPVQLYTRPHDQGDISHHYPCQLKSLIVQFVTLNMNTAMSINIPLNIDN